MLKPSELSFQSVVTLLEACAKSKPTKKRELLRSFNKQSILPYRTGQGCEGLELYEVYRLLLPGMDSDRGNYVLKETRLVSALAMAANVEKGTSRRERVFKWKDPETRHAGHFADVMHEYLFTAFCAKQPGDATLKVGQLNGMLDELVGKNKLEEKAEVLRSLMRITSALQMRYIVSLILGDLKVGLSAKIVMSEFHEDAEHFYNMDMNLQRTITSLKDPNIRPPRKEVEPGKPVNPQLASACISPADAHGKMKGQAFVVETKLDGERIQLHRQGSVCKYISRRAIDHGERSAYNVLNLVVQQQLSTEACILDGEMIVWNKTKGAFEPFGHLKTVTHAVAIANGSSQTDSSLGGFPAPTREAIAELVPEDLELMYVAFDILYYQDRSVIDLPLRERHKILQQAVTVPEQGIAVGNGQFTARIVTLTPGAKLPNGAVGCMQGSSEADIQRIFDEAIRVEEEGIVVKALESTWKSNDRSLAWLKMKPDYLHDLEQDALIIGACYGQGRRSAGSSRQLAEFLVALGKPSRLGGEITEFVSFCKVATGLSDAERHELSDRLRPNLVKHSSKNVPKMYHVTDNPKARPDVWVQDPQKSVILEVHGDMRLITSKVFNTKYSLRFPRITRIRYDKPASAVNTEDDLDRHKDNQARGMASGTAQPGRSSKGKKANRRQASGSVPLIPQHLGPSDTSHIAAASDALKHAKICFLNHGSRGKGALEGLVKQLGGQTWQMYGPQVTHQIAAVQDRRVQAQAKANHDVITLDWLLECEAEQKQIPLCPRHYMHLSLDTMANSPNLDMFGDMYSTELNGADVAAILTRHAELDAAQSALSTEPYGASTDDVIAHVEAELASHGHAAAEHALFHGCHASILTVSQDVDEGSSSTAYGRLFSSTAKVLAASADTAQILMQARQTRLKLQILHGGGHISKGVSPETTLLILVQADSTAAAAKHEQQQWDQEELLPVQPEQLLAAAKQQGGVQSLIYLKQLLLEQRLRIITPGWVDACISRSGRNAAAAEDYQVLFAAEDGAAAEPAVPSRAATWPWAEHGVTTPPKRAAPAAKKRSRGKQAVAEPEAAGDDSAAASGAEFEGKQKKRRIRAPRAKAAPRASEVVKRQVAGKRKAMAVGAPEPSTEETATAQEPKAVSNVSSDEESAQQAPAQEAREQGTGTAALSRPRTLRERLAQLPAPLPPASDSGAAHQQPQAAPQSSQQHSNQHERSMQEQESEPSNAEMDAEAPAAAPEQQRFHQAEELADDEPMQTDSDEEEDPLLAAMLAGKLPD